MITRLPWRSRGLVLSLLLTLSGCGPLGLVKSDLPPVLPGIIPPGPTVTHPPLQSYVLAGKISGMQVQRVEAIDVSSQQHFEAIPDSSNSFQFSYLDPRLYQLKLVSESEALILHKLIVIATDRSVYVNITVQQNPLKVVVDGIPVGVDRR